MKVYSGRYNQFAFLAALFILISLHAKSQNFPLNETGISIPFGGNAFLLQGTENGARINSTGLVNWTDPQTICTLYFYAEQSGNLKLSLCIKDASTNNKIQATILGKNYLLTMHKSGTDTLFISQINVPAKGYIAVKLQGITKANQPYCTPADLLVSSATSNGEIGFVKDPKDFHFGRRGPSVHWNFKVPDAVKNEVAYFYNEIYVPKGQDIIGSYFEANGFSYGYFGMQVNSETQRRVLFSIWSPFSTNNPSEIPDNQKIKLISKGNQVHGGEFGNEGSGGQSYLTYPWKADTHYSFLLKAVPDSVHNTTRFTAYFKQTNAKNWLLIASFDRPQTNSYLKSLYSFLENFSPDQGNIKRRGYYTNQWVADKEGNWYPIDQAKFTTDATGNAKQREDYTGGVDQNGFYLENAGFFDQNGRAIKNKIFSHKNNNKAPVIDFTTFP